MGADPRLLDTDRDRDSHGSHRREEPVRWKIPMTLLLLMILRDPLVCANGASQYLFHGGIITATNVVGVLAGCARQAALKVCIWNY